jgi:ABC-type transport system substrate-binding protein
VRRTLLIPAALALLAAGCGSDETKTVTVTSTPPVTVTVTTPTSTTPATGTGTSSGDYRKPKPGEGQITVTGNVADGQTRKLPGTGETSIYTYFVLQPEDGGPALRVAVAGDLDIDPKVRAAIIDPRCGGKLRGTFTVAAAPARETAFDWELVSAQLLNTCSRA